MMKMEMKMEMAAQGLVLDVKKASNTVEQPCYNHTKIDVES